MKSLKNGSKQILSTLCIAAALVATGCSGSKAGNILQNSSSQDTGDNGNGGDNGNAGGNNGGQTPAVPTVYTVFGIDSTGHLVTATSDDFTSISDIGAITGLQSGENIAGISFSPQGELYALGNTSRIYKIDTATGVASEVGAGPFSPALNGSKFGFSYNPSTYHLRVTSDAGQNLDIDATSGTPLVTSDTPLAYAAGDAHNGATPNIVISSSSCNCDGIEPTIYGIDASLGILVSIGSITGSPVAASAGQLFSIGAVSFDVTGRLALTLPDKSEYAFVASAGTGATFSKIYKLKLSDGSSTLLGDATGINPIETLSVVP